MEWSFTGHTSPAISRMSHGSISGRYPCRSDMAQIFRLSLIFFRSLAVVSILYQLGDAAAQRLRHSFKRLKRRVRVLPVLDVAPLLEAVQARDLCALWLR